MTAGLLLALALLGLGALCAGVVAFLARWPAMPDDEHSSSFGDPGLSRFPTTGSGYGQPLDIN